MENVTYDRLTTRTSAAVAAGSADENTTGVAVKGYVDHTHHALIGTITAGAVTGIKIQESDDDSSYTDVAGKTLAIADDGDDLAYLLNVGVHELLASTTHTRLVIERATQNAVIDGAICVQRRMTP